jgi:hypothetical protein
MGAASPELRVLPAIRLDSARAIHADQAALRPCESTLTDTLAVVGRSDDKDQTPGLHLSREERDRAGSVPLRDWDEEAELAPEAQVAAAHVEAARPEARAADYPAPRQQGAEQTARAPAGPWQSEAAPEHRGWTRDAAAHRDGARTSDRDRKRHTRSIRA